MTGRLQTWMSNNKPKDEMRWRDPFWEQTMFVRDKFAGLLASTYEQYQDLVDVVSTHMSKSIVCPVYYINLAPRHHVELWMRYNYFNWNVSVDARALGKDLDCDFIGCFDQAGDGDYGYCYCEGMEKWKFPSYKEDKRRFTVCINSHYDLYVFARVLRKFLGIKKED